MIRIISYPISSSLVSKCFSSLLLNTTFTLFSNFPLFSFFHFPIEICDDFGLLHDPTTHWVKELNRVFIRVVNEKGEVYKIPFSMKKVSGSFTVEALCTELIKEISSIKKLQGNASETIRIAVEKSHRASVKSEKKYKQLHNELKVRNWIIEQGCLVQRIFPWAFYDFIKLMSKYIKLFDNTWKTDTSFHGLLGFFKTITFLVSKLSKFITTLLNVVFILVCYNGHYNIKTFEIHSLFFFWVLEARFLAAISESIMILFCSKSRTHNGFKDDST